MSDTPRPFFSRLFVLLMCLMMLLGHLLYLILTNPVYFPVNTVKIVASYQHISRTQLEKKLQPYLQHGFYGLSTRALQVELLALTWSDSVIVERIWPDTLKITVHEKIPVAIWNNHLLTASGVVFQPVTDEDEWSALPRLSGMEEHRVLVVQTYKKFSEMMHPYGLTLAELTLRANQAWELKLTNGTLLRLGKQDIDRRIKRFCRAYPAVFAGKTNQVAQVDLRYAHGMAIQWQP
jgi:cell division protein FtsQ